MDRSYTILVGNLMVRDHYKYVGLDERIILEWVDWIHLVQNSA